MKFWKGHMLEVKQIWMQVLALSTSVCEILEYRILNLILGLSFLGCEMGVLPIPFCWEKCESQFTMWDVEKNANFLFSFKYTWICNSPRVPQSPQAIWQPHRSLVHTCYLGATCSPSSRRPFRFGGPAALSFTLFVGISGEAESCYVWEKLLTLRTLTFPGLL